MKQKVLNFKRSLNRGIHSSPSIISMRNSVYTCVANTYTFKKGMHDLQFHTNDFSIIWRINYKAAVIGSNIRCDLMKQPGETVSAG